MAFYKFNWSKKNNQDDEVISNINPSEITTEEVKQFISSPIKKDDEKEEINEEVLLLAIKHFIDTSFKKDSDINKMGYERTDDINGDISYNYRGIIVDVATNNYLDIPNQRYIEAPSVGQEKTIPLSFYFDVSGSMYEHTDFLAKISFLLLKNGISILYGFNEYINGMILADDGLKTIEELKKALTENNLHGHLSDKESKELNKFLRGRKAEKCVIFADFDPYEAIVDLSYDCKVYWFCFENRYNSPRYSFKGFKGNAYYVDGFDSMKSHFVNMDNYEYVEKQKKLILDITSRRKKNENH